MHSYYPDASVSDVPLHLYLLVFSHHQLLKLKNRLGKLKTEDMYCESKYHISYTVLNGSASQPKMLGLNI